ncbi:zinc ABC transporter ATP-binding protein AztA [Nocardia sp. NBC_00881]|uniref:zinc ABC transporter ATP-binding protein AztA n=1 Tax=Nocardia sp. NBC_00881 TaxID=2975995 RepID=UPI003870B8F6|nr:zinc ABC transporter ATP-binding protein AztA [Nocardia sp. NBC_00881]
MRHTTGHAIRVERLHAGYHGRPVLYDVTASIPHGRITALVGPNGSGKSTLMGVLAGVVRPEQGSVHRTSVHRPAFVMQHTTIPATLPLTVRDTVSMGRWAHRGPWRRLSSEDHTIVHRCLERMAVGDLAPRRLDTLSGGQRQRVLLAQALAQESDVLLLDEPAAGLDSESHQEISRVLTELGDQGVTVVHATHDHEEARRADHCLVLRDGQVRAEGPPATALSDRRPL